MTKLINRLNNKRSVSKENRFRDPVATRTALLRAAARLFSRGGFDGATNRQIADLARVNQALIRYHFGGKLGLYQAVVSDALQSVRESLEDIRASIRPASERLCDLLTLLSDQMDYYSHFPSMLLYEHLAGGKRLTPEIMGEVAQLFITTRKIVRDGVATGEFRPVDPHAFHLSMIGGLVYFLVSEPWRDRARQRNQLPAPAPGRKEYIHHMSKLLLDGILAPKTPKPGGKE